MLSKNYPKERLYSEELHRLTLVNISDAVFVTGAKGKFTYVCPNVSNIFGYSTDEVWALGNIDQLLGKNLYNPTLLQSTGELSNIERKITDKVGVEHCLLVTVKQVFIDAGVLLYTCRDITERKRAEERFQEQHAILNAALNSYHDILFFALDTKYRYIAFNGNHVDEMSRIYGVEIAIGMNMLDLISIPKIRRKAKNSFDRVLEGEKFTEVEIQPKFDIYYEFSWSPVRHIDGSVKGIACFIKEITEAKKRDNMLRRYEQIISVSNDSMSLVNRKYVYQAVNETHSNLLGITREKTIGKTMAKILGKTIFEKLLKEKVDRCLKGEEVRKQDWFDFSSIKHRYMDVVFSPALDKLGNIVGVVIISRDITEIKNAEDALRKSEFRLQRIIEKSPIPMSINSADGKIEYLNRKFVQLFGWALEDIPTLDHWWRLAYPDESYRKEVQKSWEQSVSITNVIDIEVAPQLGRIVCKNGNYREVEFKMVRLSDERLVVTMNDITDAKAAENKIKASLLEKEILLREVHHRVKNNMQLVNSLLRLQSSKIKDKQYVELFKESQSRIKAMSLIHELLYQSGNFADIDFDEYIGTLTKGLFRTFGIKANDIVLQTQIESFEINIENAIPCGMIINELVSNSLKHAFPKRKKGEIRIVFRPVEKNELELIVSDNGVGMPQDTELAQPVTLGLTLVRMLVEKQLEGKISWSKPQVGCECHIRLLLNSLKKE